MKQPKQKPCKVCKKPFLPATSLHSVCSWQCSIKLAEKMRLEREKRETRERKLKLKTRQDWLREAQSEFNKYIRLRDRDLPCISCGRYHSGQYHAGHYRTIGSSPQLRFNENNVHKQCAPCNNHLSGNIVNYRLSLINKIGIVELEKLENYHDTVKWDIEQIKAIKAEYKAKIKAMINL
jgi:hypothetical protein